MKKMKNHMNKTKAKNTNAKTIDKEEKKT